MAGLVPAIPTLVAGRAFLNEIAGTAGDDDYW